MSGLVVAAVAALVLAPAPVPQPDPPPGPVVIEVGTVSGSGCPKGVSIAVSADGTSFSAEYAAKARPGDFRRQCRISLGIYDASGRFTYGIRRADHRGFADLAAGADGSARWESHFSGNPYGPGDQHVFRGPYSDAWRAGTDVEPVHYDRCDSPAGLNLTTEVSVRTSSSDPDTTSQLTLESGTYHLSWRACPQ